MAVDADTIRRAEERVGSVLNGKYRLDHVVGIGGMAVVYAATHRNQKQFAVKMLHPELSIRADVRTRFLREGYAANSVKHAGAVAVMDDDLAADGAAFLVMELLEGVCVETIWQKHDRKLALASVLAIGHQLLDVLAAAHAKGIIHRDIKPANLFVTEEGQLKVLDFGIARVRDMVGSGVEGTGTGMVLGTPAFMAPEQALAKANEINAQTDIWAVGATLFVLLGGEHVHEGENAPQLLVRTATTPARSLATVNADIPVAVVTVVDRALAFHNSDRWPTAAAMRDAIRDAHLSVFGKRVSRESLLPVASSERAALDPIAETEPSSKGPLVGRGASLSPVMGASRAPTIQPVSDTPTTKPSPIGTTSQAMSSARERSGPPTARSRRRMVTGVVSIAAVALA
ncbi:MAG TPA: serine/threonine-protein kinase, partial [Polyangiaceae bacterium]|nr:serine/threonine-protein kinase [Polyangiaceae bacterium]